MSRGREDESRSMRISTGELSIHVQDWAGVGATIVFAHATGFLGAVWGPIIRRLRLQGFHGRIVTYDQRGHGLSSKPDRGYDWQCFVDDMVIVLERAGIERALGVGHSAGATTLACAAVQSPGRLRRLVMIDPILFDAKMRETSRQGDNTMAIRTRTRRLVWPSREAIFASYRSREPYSTWTDEALHAYVDDGTFERPDGEIELLCPGRIEAQIYENAASMDVFGCLSELDLPVLLVRGEHSESFPARRAQAALSCLSNARLTTLQGATHYVPMELPDEVARLVLAELDA